MTLTFPVVTCSQCGKAFAGPRPCGFSHCHHHKRLRVLTHQEEYAMRQQKPDPRGEGHSMSDQNLRERLMDYGVSGDERSGWARSLPGSFAPGAAGTACSVSLDVIFAARGVDFERGERVATADLAMGGLQLGSEGTDITGVGG